ncbi:MAG TPA: TetR family transcriptional regulator [Pseudonocardiaceae bacterium]|nr:TetR family transcriptional regulator [Pseudonocardiaceae bacterium]
MTTAGLRERKKQRTRCALIDSAFALFQRKGFDATTVDEIAEAVDVSPRTFFRYFTSKEEVALSLLDDQLGALLTLVEQRPAEESVLTALRNAGMEVLRACEAGENGFDPTQFQSMQLLMSSSPALTAHAMEQSAARLTDMARVIGSRMGVDHRVDPRPYLVASVALCTIQTAVNAWRETEPDAPSSDLIDRAFRLLAEGIDYPSAARD